MLIAELLENDAIDPKMVLRKIARQMRDGELVFPNFFAYFSQTGRLSIPLIFPVRGLEKQYNLPFKFRNDIKINVNCYDDSIESGYGIFCEIEWPNIPQNDIEKEVNYFLKPFILNYFSTKFKNLTGYPTDGEFDYNQAFISVIFEWRGDLLKRKITNESHPYLDTINYLTRKLLINDFANLVKTIQHVE